MINDAQVTHRQRAILIAVIDLYISGGEPVGSQSVARILDVGSAAGLSSATIRNAMADLAEAGLLEQPHTSAGRIPTARAFRWYVEQLNGDDRIAPARLAQSSRLQIDTSFKGIAGADAFLERTSHVLATLSSGVGVALATVNAGDLLEHVHFSRLAQRRVLAVVVTRSGLVRDRVLTLDHDLDLLQLETAARFLNENFRGWSIENVRAEIAARTERERSEYQQLLSRVEDLWSRMVPGSGAAEQTIYIEGVSNLIGGQEDHARLRDMLAALETKERLIELLNAYIDARQESVRVVFDMDEHAPEMQGLVLIAAPAMVDGESRGAVGVIGPKRMHYENTMNAVGYVAQLFARMQHTGEDDSQQVV